MLTVDNELLERLDDFDTKLVEGFIEWDAQNLFTKRLCLLDCVELSNISMHLKSLGFDTKASSLLSIETKIIKLLKELYLYEKTEIEKFEEE